MPSQDQIAEQQNLLATHRRTLAHYLVQRAKLSDMYIPPGIAHGILDARAEIWRIKATLRGWGVQVEDLPDDVGGPGEPPTTLPPTILPFPRNQVFVGRDGELRRLTNLLKEPGAVVVISGMGGIGKTQLAIEFAHRCNADPKRWPGGVTWISMNDLMPVDSTMANISLIPGNPHDNDLPFAERVQRVAQAWRSPIPHLLVFDECEDPKHFHPWRPWTASARVLITSRNNVWPLGVAFNLPLSNLQRQDAIGLLLKGRVGGARIVPERLSIDPAADAICADAICEELGDLPLAIHMAAAYLAENPILSLSDYLNQLRAQKLDHDSLRTLDPTLPDDLLNLMSPTGHVGIIKTIELSYNTLNLLARHILDLTTYCAPGEPIPLNLLRRVVHRSKSDGLLSLSTTSGSRSSQDLIGASCDRLYRISLASYTSDGQALVVHRLVRAYAEYERRKSSPTDHAAVADAVALTLVELIQDASNTKLPSTVLLLLPHARHIADTAEQRRSPFAVTLISDLGDYFFTIGDLARAHELQDRALNVGRRIYGDDHPNIASRILGLANVARARGNREKARDYYKDALRIEDSSRLPGEMHLPINLEQQQLWLEINLQHDEAIYSHADPRVALWLTKLGNLAQKRGEYVKACTLLEQAFLIVLNTYGPDHPEVACAANNLGHATEHEGDLDKARGLFERALHIDEARYDLEHPVIAIRAVNCARVAHARHDLVAASEMYKRALQIVERYLGDRDQEVITLVDKLGEVIQAQGDVKEAQRLFERALQLCETVFGHNHHQVAIQLNKLGSLALKQGNGREARRLYERALRILKIVFGPDHPSTRLARDKLASVLAGEATEE